MSSGSSPPAPSHVGEATHDDLAVPDETLRMQKGLSRGDLRFLLIKAAMNGDLEEVQRLVGEVEDIDGYLPRDRDLFGWEDEERQKSRKEPISTALQSAARWGHQEVVWELIKSGADINIRPWRVGGRTALQAAAECGHKTVVDMLLDAGAEVNAASSKYYGRTALQAAAEGGYEEVVDLLLNFGAEIDAMPSEHHGITALQAAAGGGHEAVVRMLLEFRAEADVTPLEFQITALQAAAGGGHKTVVELLLRAGAEVVMSASDYEVALQGAAEGGHEAVMEVLFEAVVEVGAAMSRSCFGTALQVAAGGGHQAAVEMLLSVGVGEGAAMPIQGLALQAAAEGGHQEVMKILLEAVTKSDAVKLKSEWSRALEAAVKGNHEAILDMLLQAGAKFAISISGLEAALQAGAGGGQAKIVDMLLRAGGRINVAEGSRQGVVVIRLRGSNGFAMSKPGLMAALQAAARGGHQAVVEKLLSAGAKSVATVAALGEALQAAAEGGHQAVVEKLLSAEFESVITVAALGEALQAAAKGGHQAVVERLLAAGVEASAEMSISVWEVALRVAAGGGHQTAVEKLLSAEFESVITVAALGQALQAAAKGGHQEVVWRLLTAGVEVNAEMSISVWEVALRVASGGGHQIVVGILLRAVEGFDVARLESGNREALEAAAEGGHEAVVEMLLKAGAQVDPAEPLPDKRSALQAAAEGGHQAVVEKLLAVGIEADAAISIPIWEAALRAAAGGGHQAVIEALLKAVDGFDSTQLKLGWGKALEASAKGNHYAAMRMLFEAGAKFKIPISGFDMALQVAAEGGYEELMEMLLESGVKFGAVKPLFIWGSALQAAAGGGHETVVGMLIKAGARFSVAQSEFGRAALYEAVKGGHEAVVEILLKAGVKVNDIPSDDGRTVLQTAMEGGHGTLVAALINAGANINASWLVDDIPVTAVTMVIKRGDLATLKLLVNHGAFLTTKDSLQQTCFHLAIYSQNLPILRYLLNLRLSNLINEKDYNGMTVLHIASESRNTTLLQYLLAAGPNLEIKDNKGRRPLDIAIENGPLHGVCKLLLAKGADIRGRRMNFWRTRLEPLDDELIFLQETLVGGKDVRILKVSDVPEFREYSDLVSRKHLYSIYGTQSEQVADKLFSLPIPSLGPRDYGPRSPKPGATIDWGWAVPGGVFNPGIPGDGRSTSASFEGIVTCTVSFDMLVSNSVQGVADTEITKTKAIGMGAAGMRINDTGGSGLAVFETKRQKVKISWVMWKVEIEAADPVSQTEDPTKPNYVGSSINSSKSMYLSMHFRSSMDHGWIPSHGVEFFTLFVDHLHEQWMIIGAQADLHLVDSRAVVLGDEGRTPKLIAGLLKDAQQWDDFDRLLQSHVHHTTILLKMFRETPILHDEVKVTGLTDEETALKTLEDKINYMRDDCKAQISNLSKRTEDLIQLEFNLVSIHEAQISTSTAMSMKRLSWITFVFLPLLFVVSLFGMNVNLFNHDSPRWWWYFVISGPAFALVFIVWLVFKYIKIEAWVETSVGVYLEKFAISFSEKFKSARSRRARTRDPELGSSSTPPRQLDTRGWFDHKKTKNS